MGPVEWLSEALRDPGALIAWGGYPVLAAVVFLETGALVFFLPGDSLLVMAGLYAANGDLSLTLLNALLVPMAVAGDAVSYWIGSRLGSYDSTKERPRLLGTAHVQRARAFYDRHGGKAIVLARFLPVARTFVPVVAGVAGMPYRRFATFNVLGAIGWVGSMTLVGHLLGSRFPSLVDHLEIVVLMIVLISILPALTQAACSMRGRSRATPSPCSKPGAP